MKVKRILVGAIIWSLGLFVPVLHHGLLSMAAIHSRSHAYNYHRLVKYFSDLPWVDGVFLVVMWLVGLVLLISGFRPKTADQ